MDKIKAGACGIDCDQCNLYRASFDIKAAESLVKWFRKQGWIKPDENAEAVQKMGPFCSGCWEKGVQWSDGCSLRSCCETKGIGSCGDCGEFPCGSYREWAENVPHHKKAMEELLSSRERSADSE